MSNNLISAWYAILPPSLLHQAYRASNGELAWAKSDALAVVHFIEERGYDISIVEPWLPTKPGPTPLIDDWDQQGNRGMSAEEFITTFRWTLIEAQHAGLEVVFAIEVEPRA